MRLFLASDRIGVFHPFGGFKKGDGQRGVKAAVADMRHRVPHGGYINAVGAPRTRGSSGKAALALTLIDEPNWSGCRGNRVETVSKFQLCQNRARRSRAVLVRPTPPEHTAKSA